MPHEAQFYNEPGNTEASRGRNWQYGRFSTNKKEL